MEKLERLGVRTVADLQRLSQAELVREVGRSWGESLAALAFARDDRPVSPGREMKSVSTEHTFEHDVREREELEAVLERDAAIVAARVAKARLFARTITVKVRRADFSTHTRSRTLTGATDDAEVFARVGRELLAGVEIAGGVRLLGIGVGNFTEAAQEELFAWGSEGAVDVDERTGANHVALAEPGDPRPTYRPGADVEHDDHGRGWVWGSGLGRVTVRFETARTGPGPVRTFAVDDPALRPAEALLEAEVVPTE